MQAAIEHGNVQGHIVTTAEGAVNQAHAQNGTRSFNMSGAQIKGLEDKGYLQIDPAMRDAFKDGARAQVMLNPDIGKPFAVSLVSNTSQKVDGAVQNDESRTFSSATRADGPAASEIVNNPAVNDAEFHSLSQRIQDGVDGGLEPGSEGLQAYTASVLRGYGDLAYASESGSSAVSTSEGGRHSISTQVTLATPAKKLLGSGASLSTSGDRSGTEKVDIQTHGLHETADRYASEINAHLAAGNQEGADSSLREAMSEIENKVELQVEHNQNIVDSGKLNQDTPEAPKPTNFDDKSLFKGL